MSNRGAIVEQQVEWVVAHEALSRLAKARAAADVEEGRWLLAALRSAAHVHLGFGSFAEYVGRLFGYQPRSIQERLRVAEALEHLPSMGRALEQGTLHWSAVRELTRVAAATNEREWIEVARGKTVRQLEELVAGKCVGDGPSSPSQPDARPHVLRFEVMPETFALFREALTALRRSTDAALDDNSALLAMARHVLGGPVDEGRASYQIVLSVCPDCGRGQQAAGGELVPIGADVVRMAHCDGQHLGYVAPPPADSLSNGALANDNARPDADVGGAHGCADVGDAQGGANAGGARSGSVDATDLADRHLESRPDRGAPVGAKACGATVHAGGHLDAYAEQDSRAGAGQPVDGGRRGSPVGAFAPAELGRGRAPVGAASAVSSRAQQTVPPALRRSVLLRDQRRCRVPGCRNSRFLDLHHLELRSEGGPTEAANLVTLCGAHHHAAHRGQLVVERSPTEGVRFRHAEGREYGQTVQPRTLEAYSKTFSALRNLGFREGEVRAVLAKLRGESSLRDASTEQLLRAALACLTRPRTQR